MKSKIVYLLVTICAGLLITKGIVPGWRNLNSDFSNYYVSAKLIADQVPIEHLYDNEWFQTKINDYGINTPGKFSPFPPITAFVMLPLTSFEPLFAQRIFIIVNLLFIVIGTIVLSKLTSWSISSSTLFILGSGLGAINNIAFGQLYLIMTVSILTSFLLVNKNHVLLAGIILGFFTALKYFPMVVIVGFFLSGMMEVYRQKTPFKKNILNNDLRVTIYSAITFLLLSTFQYFYFGSVVFNDWIYSAFLPHLNSELRGQGMFSYQFQSWDSLFRNFFVFDIQSNQHPLFNWALGRTVLKAIVTLLITTTSLVTLIKIRYESSSVRRAVCLSLPAVAALVLLPASATYHFVLLVPSLVLIIHELPMTNRLKISIFIVYGFIGLIPYQLAFRLGEAWNPVFAYPRLWLISILFILVVSAIWNRGKTSFA